MARRGKTELNAAIERLMAENSPASPPQTTEINPSVAGKNTEINAVIGKPQNKLTEVNSSVRGMSANIPVGTVLADKYTIEGPLSASSGEANLYMCKYRKKDYVAKVYRRQSAIKSGIVVALEDMKSANIARLYATGEWNGFPFEILPYYKFGSLEGKTFPFEQLRKHIIPALNDGLKALHDREIIHKDLKPSNIMMCDDEKNVAIIDFGISSIREGGATVVVTNTGMTPEYSAPETFRGLFLEESDYYSLGVTLYQLYTGHTPYTGLDRDTIERYVAIQTIPFPDAFPPELKRLIIGLTYNDITNRRDKSNPNRRWTYEEVKKWCKGEPLELPGGAEAKSDAGGTETPMPALRFQYKTYKTVESLTEAIGSDWENGKKRLYRSLLAGHFRTFDQELANYCIDAEESVSRDPSKADIEFFSLLYKIYPQMPAFHWRSYHYADMKSMGDSVLYELRSQSAKILEVVGEFCENHLFSIRERTIAGNQQSRAGYLEAIESRFLQGRRAHDVYILIEQAFLLGYIYSETKDLICTYGKFDSIEALTQYVKMVLKDHPDAMDSVSNELMRSTKNGESEFVTAAPQYAAWLTIQGKSDALK